MSENIITQCRQGTLKVTKETYDKAFGEYSNFDDYNLKMFEERARARAYVFGSFVNPLEEDPRSEWSKKKRGIPDKILNPLMIDTKGGVVCHVNMGEYSLGLVSESGKCYIVHSGGIMTPPCQVKRTGFHFVVTSVLDKDDVMWMYMAPRKEWSKGGRDKCQVVYHGKGVYKSLNPTIPNILRIQSALALPGPELLGYVAMDSSFIDLYVDGTVAAFHRSEMNPLKEVNALGPFIQVKGIGASNHYGLLRQDGRVVEIYLDPWSYAVKDVHLVEGLTNIASIAIGKEHGLALTKTGEVYSWGKDLFGKGCLGTRAIISEKPQKVGLPGKAFGVYAGAQCSAVLTSPM